MNNKVILIGRLANDLELKSVGDSKLINVNIAVPRSYKNKDGVVETDFIRCVMWGNVAERTNEHCKKGDLVGIEGSLEVSSYEVDGESRKAYEVRVSKISFLSSKKEVESVEG